MDFSVLDTLTNQYPWGLDSEAYTPRYIHFDNWRDWSTWRNPHSIYVVVFSGLW